MMGRIKEHMQKGFMVYSGCDEMLLSGLISGADAAIGSTYNVIPDLYISASNHLKSGNTDIAKRELMTANAILEEMFKYGINSSIRAMFEFMGIDAGYSPLPFCNLNTDEKTVLKKSLQKIKYNSELHSAALFEYI